MTPMQPVGAQPKDDVYGIPNSFLDSCPDGAHPSFLILQGPVLLGGGEAAHDPSGDYFLTNCWQVSDLTVDHWATLPDDPPKQIVWVPLRAMQAVRATLVRGADVASTLLSIADARRNGMLDVVAALQINVDRDGGG